jgi:hypothetical protein
VAIRQIPGMGSALHARFRKALAALRSIRLRVMKDERDIHKVRGQWGPRSGQGRGAAVDFFLSAKPRCECREGFNFAKRGTQREPPPKITLDIEQCER